MSDLSFLCRTNDEVWECGIGDWGGSCGCRDRRTAAGLRQISEVYYERTSLILLHTFDHHKQEHKTRHHPRLNSKSKNKNDLQ